VREYFLNTQNIQRQPTLFPTEYSVELRQRVARLETARANAWASNDRDAVDRIDREIKQVIVAWTDSFIGDFEWRYRKMV
jgi:hypothetical protein